MDTTVFNWLNDDSDIMDSLVSLAALSEEPSNQASNNNNNAGTDILQYLFQPNDNSNPNDFGQINQPISPQPQQTNNQVIDTHVPAAATTPDPNDIITDPYLKSTVSVVQAKDNFVTFMPVSTPKTKKQSGAKKTKFKEPIFVTESPQSYNKKKKKSAPSNTHSSGDENSDDDMLLDEELAASNTSASQLKQMTSKERRQLRNKISARNFRVRRKEYITQLEETVEEYENTIKGLKDENAKLRKSNQDLMKQVLSQPITPPTSSGDELLSSSGSEGHQSPEPVPSLFQFQLNDIYDFNLFDQQTLNQPDQPMQINDSANMFFLNHATMPDWDIHQVLGEKGRPVTSEEHQSQLSKELISNYPLLAPALMSIVLRHTLSLEYVTSLAKELEGTLSTDHVKSSTIDDDQETLRGVDMEDLKASFNSLKIEDIKKKEEEEEEEEEEEKENDDDEKLTEEEKAERKANKLKDEELVDMMLNDYFAYYAVMRARGFTHQQLVDRCRECLKQKYLKKSLRENKKQAKQKAAESKSSKWSTNAQTLQTYCRVAGSLLRHPQRMAHVRQVLKKEIVFTQNKHTVHIENNYRKLVNGNYKNQCITNTTTTC